MFLRIPTVHVIHSAISRIMHRARAEKTAQAHIGLVAVALTSLAIYFLKLSVTPHFFAVDHFLFHFPIDCEKMNKKSMWEGKKFPIFLCTRRRILAFVRLLGE